MLSSASKLTIGNWELAITSLFLLDLNCCSPARLRLNGFRSGCEHGARDCGRQAHGFSVLEVSVNPSNNHTRFDRDQVDTYEGDSDPGVNHDALVEHTIKNIN